MKKYKLMIVEDEYFERESIKLLISEMFSDKIVVVAEAGNGSAAVDKIFYEKPDIILFDIHMPKLNGLSAAEIIKDKLPNVEILILTANSKFEYAKKAIQIGVNDFLVKPYSNESFEEALKNVISKILNRENRNRKYEKFEENIDSVKDVLERELLDIITSDLDFEKDIIMNYVNLLHITESNYCVLAIKAIKKSNEYKLTHKIKQELSFVTKKVFGTENLGKSIFICFVDNKYQFETKLSKLNKILKNEIVDIYYAKSGYRSNFKDIKTSYLLAENQLIENMKEFRISKLSFPFDVEEALYKKIFNCDKAGSLELLDKIFNHFNKQEIQEINFEMKKFLKQIILLIDRLLNQNLSQKTDYFQIEELLKKIDEENRNNSIYSIIEKYLINSIELLKAERNKKGNKFIEIAKHYIGLNYEKSLSLSEVADYVGMSSYHLSKSFKKETGVNFKEYLTKTKIEASKNLLLKGELTISEIAYSIGFNDPGYFSTSFKKNTGISPKEFVNSKKTNN